MSKKAIPTGKRNEWLVITFYVSPNLGECHTNYQTVYACCEAQAIAEAA